MDPIIAFQITWSTLKDGVFPKEQLEALNITVTVFPQSMFSSNIILQAGPEDSFDKETIFRIGMLVQSYQAR